MKELQGDLIAKMNWDGQEHRAAVAEARKEVKEDRAASPVRQVR